MNKGFTLIEIIIILAVISIVLLIASPSVSGFIQRDRLKAATDILVSDLRYSKMYAVSKNEGNVHIRFIRASGSEDYDSYLIYSFNGAYQYNLKSVKLPEGVRICSRTETNGSTFDISEKLTFQAEGSVSPYACTIALKDLDRKKKEYITLTIGYTRIMRVPR